ncbi:mannitol dehydrogenase family protein [Phytohalomonas tamaricis]|uniref:mannitol dehydrogenase family protein n=1 Tax=Phytohalomonas tamaricis TaxID=2081032 RepID=UPI000D0B3DCF|nr:mannitol dehydrogenase [Phytohalomonas tamaricis]
MSATTANAQILQFGTSRFLLAHVDAFVSESLASGASDKKIMVVQTSNRPEGRDKARHLAAHPHYPLRIRGRRDGQDIDEEKTVTSLAGCLIAAEQWPELEQLFIGTTTHVVSNTADRGFEVPDDDSPHHEVPASFPCKLLKLLHARFTAGRDGVTLMPCELVVDNGQVLKRLVLELAMRHYDEADFNDWLMSRCLWVDSLVDRIVSEPLEPVGAVAEPYALWAVKSQPGLEMPCRHPDVTVAEDLTPFEKQKLHILNLSHTYLIHLWRRQGLEDSITYVREAMAEPKLRTPLEALLDDEVIPVLAAAYPELNLDAYKATTFERFENPFLDHRLSDIAGNHEEKVKRRLAPVLALSTEQGIEVPTLTACVAGYGG